jgi:hypothetical protein
MVPTDNGRQSVVLLKRWVGIQENRAAQRPRSPNTAGGFQRVVCGRRRLHPAIGNASLGRIVVTRAPRLPNHDPQTLRGRLFDRQAGTALDVELQVGACLASTPHLQPAVDASSVQGTASVEDRISATLDQVSPGIRHPIALAVLGQAGRKQTHGRHVQLRCGGGDRSRAPEVALDTGGSRAHRNNGADANSRVTAVFPPPNRAAAALASRRSAQPSTSSSMEGSGSSSPSTSRSRQASTRIVRSCARLCTERR